MNIARATDTRPKLICTGQFLCAWKLIFAQVELGDETARIIARLERAVDDHIGIDTIGQHRCGQRPLVWCYTLDPARPLRRPDVDHGVDTAYLLQPLVVL